MELKELENLKDYLCQKYNMDIEYITPVKNVFRISSRQGDKCLKKVRYGREHFLFILSAMTHLIKNGFDGIIPFIPAENGELYVELENGYGFLTDWVASRECNYVNPIELRKAAVTLAKLHGASQGFVLLEGAEMRDGWGKWVEKFSNRIKEMNLFKEIIAGKNTLTIFDNKYLENVDYYIKQGISSIEHLKATKYFELMEIERKKNSFCHHDFAHHNVLLTNDFKVYIIDFDYCICDTRLHDLSSLIIRNMRHGGWNNMERAQYIVDCYAEEGNISEDEISVINAFIEFPQDFWQVGLQYYIEKQKWDESQFNKRLDNVINDKRDRYEFLREFKYSILL